MNILDLKAAAESESSQQPPRRDMSGEERMLRVQAMQQRAFQSKYNSAQVLIKHPPEDEPLIASHHTNLISLSARSEGQQIPEQQ